MASESYCHGTSSTFEMNKRDILLFAKASWTHLDEDSLTPTVVDNPLPLSQLEDSKEENIRHWLDSGFFLSTSEDLQQDREKAVSLANPGMVQMTVQSYMRSLHQFSETPVMSRWNSFNSSHSLPSAPKSITEWLELWEKDPVEILLDLGFGTEEPDICTKIPSRFISNASVAKGINIRVFLEAQKQRMDIENPNLYGRFRQLEVLDHVTSAFSSLLNGVNTQQQKSEESNGDEKSMTDIERNKAEATRAKRRRLGHLLRKASRQATVLQRSARASGSSESFKDREEQSPTYAEMDRRTAIRTGFSENNTLVGLTEEHSSTEDDALTLSQLPQAPTGKSQVYSYIPIKQPQLPSASEMAVKDRPRKESNLLLTHTLRRVSGLKGKPPDSFEMEEIQSFEDEPPGGNLHDSTSEVLVTRTNSCQSDSSGFLEEPPEPLPLQNPPFPGHLNLSCDTHDRKVTLPHRTALAVSHQDFHQKPKGPVANTSTADCKNIPRVSSPDREHKDQREETALSLTVEDGLHQVFSDQSEGFVKEMVYNANKQEIKIGRGQLEKEESCIQQQTPCFQAGNQDVRDIVTPEPDCHLYFGSVPKTPAPSHAEENGTTPIDFTGSGGCAKQEAREGPLTEEDAGKVLKENIQEGITGHVKGKQCDKEIFSKVDTLVPVTNATSGQQFCKPDIDIHSISRSCETGTPETQWQVSQVQNESKVISSSSLQVANFSAYCRSEFSSQESTETCCLGKISEANKMEKNDSVQNAEIHTNPSKSVTVQMSSRLVSTVQKVSLSEGLGKRQSLEIKSIGSQCSEGEPVITSELGILKESLKEMREASIQTDTIGIKTRNWWPDPNLLPPFCRRGHLTKSVSLETGLHGKYRSSYHETLGAQSAQCGHSCHCVCCHHCCFQWAFPFTASSEHLGACCSNHSTVELQLLKTLELLQDTAVRSISPCTIHEIEAMKSSCQSFREKLDEIEQHLVEQHDLFSSAMSDEGREEKRQLQVLRQAVRREVSELEFQLNDRSRQAREGILMLDQLLGEQSHLFSELGLPDWREERNAQNKQVAPDAADTTHPRAGCSETVVPRRLSRSETFPSAPSASMPGTPEIQFPAMVTAELDPQELHTSKKEIKGPPQPKIDFKAFLQSLKKSFQNFQ
ncbi:protein ITPRID1-like [Terrapene carolina triunguis]|uniref:protein ITPRID1-like n=1 Tax=Terrapene triunguis TaxID=2587831 RepID=UPI000CEF7414|nr:protein ITPRID1-like [Terrapene carolina triunguis]